MTPAGSCCHSALTPQTSGVHVDEGYMADCYVQKDLSNSRTICGDVDIFCGSASCQHPEIQVQGLNCSALASDHIRKRPLFARNVWKRDISAGLAPQYRPQSNYTAAEQGELYDVYERTAYFFLRELCRSVPPDHSARLEGHFRTYMNWAVHHVLPRVSANKHPRVRPEWCYDDYGAIMSWKEQYQGSLDLELLHAIGPLLPSILTGKIPALQVMMQDDRLGRMYKYGSGCPQVNQILGKLVEQLCYRYPKMDILEVGAGTGSTITAALQNLGDPSEGQHPSFRSYSFTDVSTGFFDAAKRTFAAYKDQMRFEKLDLEQDPMDQGFSPHSFDLLIASNVLYTTRSLDETVTNCKRLLRPGGQLFIIEITGDSLYLQTIFGILPGWWTGYDDGRVYGATITESQWDTVLRQNGFSGLDHVARDIDNDSKHVLSVLTTQSVDERVQLLRQPMTWSMSEALASTHAELKFDNLVILTAGTNGSSRIPLLGEKVQHALTPFVESSVNVITWEAFSRNHELRPLGPRSAVICLSELEQPALRRDEATEARFHTIQTVLNNTGCILWVTRGCRADEPLANMMVGVGRSVLMESSLVRIQFVDIDTPTLERTESISNTLSEMLLRMKILALPGYGDVLWSSETEAAIEDGCLHLPRVILDDELNNSISIDSGVPFSTVSSTPVASRVHAARPAHNKPMHVSSLTNVTTHLPNGQGSVHVKIHVSSPTALAPVDEEGTYLSFGATIDNEPVLALSRSSAPDLRLLAQQIISWKGRQPSVSRLIAQLLCESIFTDINGVVWLHDAENIMATAAKELGLCHSIPVLLTTSSREDRDSERVFIHDCISERALASLLPRDVQVLVYFGAVESIRRPNVVISFAQRHKIPVLQPTVDA